MLTELLINIRTHLIFYFIDKLTPYKTDLEYLDDSFQLISLMLKVKGLEKRIEQEAIYDENFKDVRTHRQKRESEYKTKVRPCKVNYLFLIRLFLEYWDGGRHFIFIFYRIYVVKL